MQELINFTKNEMAKHSFDCLAISVFDFKNHNYQNFSLINGETAENNNFYFDLASLTKVLVLATSKLIKPDLFNNELNLLLNHKAGLPAWKRLSSESWKEEILSYPVVESECCYSDISALRLMLQLKEHPYDIASKAWADGIKHWTNLNDQTESPVYGKREDHLIHKVVHDENAFYLKDKLSHAGLFATIESLSETLITLDKEFQLLEKMKRAFADRDRKERFLEGWDTAENLETTLAGQGCSDKTFGHLGFVGNSLWIDAEKERGYVLLTNSIKEYWNDQEPFNNFRRSIGQFIWSL